MDQTNIVVRKRDGVTVQPYKQDKLRLAIQKSWQETGLPIDNDTLSDIVNNIADRMEFYAENGVIDVEKIQDLVETSLMKYRHFDVAKSYILFRSKRTEVRESRLVPDSAAISSYVHPAKYGRYIPELQRREVYEETVARVEKMHLDKFSRLFNSDPDLEKDIRWAFDLVRDKRVLPSLRSMQFAGDAIEHVNARIFNCSATPIDRIDAFSKAFYLLLCGCGVGFSVQFEHIDKLPVLKHVDQKQVRHFTIADTIEGWADSLYKLMDSYVKGYTVEFNYSKIRPEGSPLKTSGGKAPGHRYLKKALEQIRGILDQVSGRRLRSIECHDIMCLMADAVLSGGIRRSSLISLFSLEDSEMMNAKTGRWFEKYPWRANSNNSVMLKRDEVKKKSFKRVFEMTRQFGEPGFVFCNDYDHSLNPCQIGIAPVLTPEGIRNFNDINIGSTIWSGSQWTRVTNKVMTGVKPTYAYHTTAGRFYGTENHKIISNGERVEVRQADTIDACQGPVPEYSELAPNDIMDGLVLGDGTKHEASNNLILLCIGAKDTDYFTSDVSHLIGEHRPGIGDTTWRCVTSLTAEEVPVTYARCIPDRFYYGNSNKVRGFLRGLYSANGSVVGESRVTLKASSFAVISRAQDMLSSLGIRSYYTTNQAHDVTFNNGTYTCRESYDLNISSDRTKFRELIGFIHKDKIKRLDAACDKDRKTRVNKTTFEIIRKECLGDQKVYDITVEAAEHTYWTGGLLVSNCAEVGLYPTLNIDDDVISLLESRSQSGKKDPQTKLGSKYSGFSFCNLCEINGAKLKEPEDFYQAVKAATIIGTLQASYTDLPYLGWVSEVIAEREALLGIGITGMMDSPDVALNRKLQKEAAELVVQLNKEYSSRIGIRQAARCTVVKPAGTSSLELGGVGSGHHPHHARRYIRRVTANELEPTFQYFKSINPHLCVKKPNGDWAIEFPIQAPDGATVKSDLTALEFLESVKQTQINWVLPGTARPESTPGINHNVSNTCVVKESEWDEVSEYLWENKEYFTGVSFIPDTGDKIYAFSPMEAVITEADEAKWSHLIKYYTPVDYTKMVESDDGTNLSGEAACAGGACEV